MAYSTRDVLETMRQDSGLKIRELRVDGGASVNDFLCRFQADILGIPVVRPKAVETTSLGAAYLAGLGAGLWATTADIERLSVDERKFTPAMSRPFADRLYAGWLAAVRKARAA
jgi:glycerol kinase